MDEETAGPALAAVLERGRDRGFLGPGPVEDHVRQARAFRSVLGQEFAGRAIDMGSGAGVPGLMLLGWYPLSSWLLLDADLRRVRFLEWAVRDLGLVSQAEVLHSRAEDLGRDDGWRSRADAVVARGFGPPGVVAECGAPLLRRGGVLAVSEPPRADGERWPSSGLDQLGLAVRSVRRREGYRLAELAQVRLCPTEFPRRPGVPGRSPLF